jgi:CRP/FNR family transcriptional regulator, cyclic AMP receptor protein
LETVVKARFEGEEGQRRLREALRDQQLLGCEGNLIDEVASALELRDAKEGDEIVVQGTPGGDVFFILMGAGLEILIDRRPVAAREVGDVVGEMSAIEPAGIRSATARAVGDTVVGKLDGDVFMRLAEAHPRTIYRAIARLVSSRLRERSKFLRPRAARPRLFVGSSVEGLPVAEAIRLAFDHGPAEVVLWSDPGSVFKPSKTPIEDLSAALDHFDFAIFVVTPDDLLKLRRKTGAPEEFEAARDNVWFEFGLFAGALGRDRVFGVTPRGARMRRPTDLIGVTLLAYDQPADARPNVGIACIQVKDQIAALKAR